MTDEKKEGIELLVEVSSVQGLGGVARISTKSIEQLGAEEGESISVTANNKSHLLTVYADDMIDPGIIKIRHGDMKDFKITAGDKVTVHAHEKFGEGMKRKLGFGTKKDEKKVEAKEKKK